MRKLLNFVVIVAIFSFGDAYSKYGRTCKDIGCAANEKCVMQEDPCTPYTKPNQCGKYPTCRKISNAAATCATYVCPPTMNCRMNRGVPKCYATSGKKNSPGHARAPVRRSNYRQTPTYPYTNYPGTAVYTIYPSKAGYGQTTLRPNVYQTGGYHGGVIGSGYPGHGNGYLTHAGGYPYQTHQHGHHSMQSNNRYSGQTYSGQGAGHRGYPSHDQYGNYQAPGQHLNRLSKHF